MISVLIVGMALGSPRPKIVNGTDATIDDFPMTGGLVVGTADGLFFDCSSTLIAPDVVLTAAHCIDPEIIGLPVTLDELVVWWSRQPDLRAWSGSTTAPPTEAVRAWDKVIHPGWTGDFTQVGLGENDDLALLFLDSAVEDVAPAIVIANGEETQVLTGTEVSVVGWGVRDPADQTSSGLKQWGLSVINAVGPTEFQVGAVASDVRKCFGDSGGPTFLEVESASLDKLRIIGVASHLWSDDNCMEEGAVETHVAAYRDWIDGEMTSRCDGGGRVWCDVAGIIPPEMPSDDLASLREDVQLVGCSAGSTAQCAPVRWALGMLAAPLAMMRRRRA